MHQAGRTKDGDDRNDEHWIPRETDWQRHRVSGLQSIRGLIEATARWREHRQVALCLHLRMGIEACLNSATH